VFEAVIRFQVRPGKRAASPHWPFHSLFSCNLLSFSPARLRYDSVYGRERTVDRRIQVWPSALAERGRLLCSFPSYTRTCWWLSVTSAGSSFPRIVPFALCSIVPCYDLAYERDTDMCGEGCPDHKECLAPSRVSRTVARVLWMQATGLDKNGSSAIYDS